MSATLLLSPRAKEGWHECGPLRYECQQALRIFCAPPRPSLRAFAVDFGHPPQLPSSLPSSSVQNLRSAFSRLLRGL